MQAVPRDLPMNVVRTQFFKKGRPGRVFLFSGNFRIGKRPD